MNNALKQLIYSEEEWKELTEGWYKCDHTQVSVKDDFEGCCDLCRSTVKLVTVICKRPNGESGKFHYVDPRAA